jgi:hypothetical protein
MVNKYPQHVVNLRASSQSNAEYPAYPEIKSQMVNKYPHHVVNFKASSQSDTDYPAYPEIKSQMDRKYTRPVSQADHNYPQQFTYSEIQSEFPRLGLVRPDHSKRHNDKYPRF